MGIDEDLEFVSDSVLLLDGIDGVVLGVVHEVRREIGCYEGVAGKIAMDKGSMNFGQGVQCKGLGVYFTATNNEARPDIGHPIQKLQRSL